MSKLTFARAHGVKVSLSVAAMAGLALSGNALGFDSTWNGNTDGNYGTTTNWTPTNVADGTATFNNAGNGNTTITVGGARNLGILRFDTVDAAAYTIGSSVGEGTFTNTNSTVTINRTSTVVASQIINSNYSLSRTTNTFTNASASGSLTINGSVTGTNASPSTLLLNGAGGNSTINGAISMNGGLEVNAGTWMLNAASTLSGIAQTVDTLSFNRSTHLSGGTLAFSDNGALGANTVVVGGNGTLQVIGTRTLSNQFVTSNSNSSITGGALTLNGAFVFGGSNTITANNASLTINGNINIRNSNSGTARTPIFTGSAPIVIAGNIVNGTNNVATFSGGLTYSGSSTLKLTGTNTYTNTTNVSAGATLVVNGAHNPFNTVNNVTVGGAYSVAGTLSGNGSINPASGPTTAISINVGGTLSPGDATQATAAQTGVLDLGNSLTFVLNAGNTSNFNVQFGGATPGDGLGFYDQVNMNNVAGTVTLNSGTNLNLSLVNNFTPVVGDIYYVLNRADAGVYGLASFLNAAEGATVTLGTDVTGTITYLANWNTNPANSTFTGGNDVAIQILTGAAAVPEPTTIGLLVGAAATMLGRRRRL